MAFALREERLELPGVSESDFIRTLEEYENDYFICVIYMNYIE
jgi:hypothetical protein